jgi:hypothetical protein
MYLVEYVYDELNKVMLKIKVQRQRIAMAATENKQ